MKDLLVFASGTPTGGGSGFEKLFEAIQTGVIENARICAVVSQYEHGGVAERAARLGVHFVHRPADNLADAAGYLNIYNNFGPDHIALSGWVLPVYGLSSRKTSNIHPAPLPRFGGKGMYSHFVHEEVMRAYRQNELAVSAVSMHYVLPFVKGNPADRYDKGPVFFNYPVVIAPNDTPDSLQHKINLIEHAWQPVIVNMLLQNQISWDGADPESLMVPKWYRWDQPIGPHGFYKQIASRA